MPRCNGTPISFPAAVTCPRRCVQYAGIRRYGNNLRPGVNATLALRPTLYLFFDQCWVPPRLQASCHDPAVLSFRLLRDATPDGGRWTVDGVRNEKASSSQFPVSGIISDSPSQSHQRGTAHKDDDDTYLPLDV
jgi:hypothetical protein